MLRRLLIVTVLLVIAFAAGAFAMLYARRPVYVPEPDGQTLVTQMRDVARLETLEVTMYKKINFEPDPKVGKTVWNDVVEWAKFAINEPKGKAIVFADVRMGLDFDKFDTRSLRVHGSAIDVVLPPITATVELKPGETEVIGSNLDSQQTAELFEKAKLAFRAEAMADAHLNEKARASAERSIRALLVTTGFKEVRFVEKIPAAEPN